VNDTWAHVIQNGAASTGTTAKNGQPAPEQPSMGGRTTNCVNHCNERGSHGVDEACGARERLIQFEQTGYYSRNDVLSTCLNQIERE
jgi:hypothetical protein